MIKYIKKIILVLERFEQMEEKEQIKHVHFLKKIPGIKLLIKEVIEC